ncbi:MAG: segregation/condensation protein A [Fimbriimonas sp.]
MAVRQVLESTPAFPMSSMGVVVPAPIHIESSVFEGSLAMLFRCVKEHKVDLLQVPLFPICEAYFSYLLDLHRDDVDEASAALAALAYLIERKAWMLLPTPEPEPEMEVEGFDRASLPESSIHEYSSVIEALVDWQSERSHLFFRSLEQTLPYELPYTLANVSAGDLARAFERLIRRAQPEVRPLGRPRKSLTEQMLVVRERLQSIFLPLDLLIEEPYSTSDAVFWFLALLELIKLGQAAVEVDGEEVLFASL